VSTLSKKVAIVTGASKGLGAGIATALGAAGARVEVNYFSDRQGAERLAQASIDSVGEAISVGADVSGAADVARLFDKVDSAFGRLDILVNNAGVFRFGAFEEITKESFHLHDNISVLRAIFTVQEAIKRFGADGGSIINLSSIVGSHPVVRVHKRRHRNTDKGVGARTCTAQDPSQRHRSGSYRNRRQCSGGNLEGGAGAILAEKTPLGRLGRVSDIALLAMFLASDESAWITGEVIRAAGGLVVAT
jgi:3-oxoacyl-[acyl-carrier protein] reductase